MSAARIPVEAGSFTYTPNSLKALGDKAPVFTLRHGTRRDRHAYHDECRFRRVPSRHDTQEFRDTLLSELREKYAANGMAIEEVVAEIERFYSAADEFEAAVDEWGQRARDWLKAEGLDEAAPETVEAAIGARPKLDFDPAERERVEATLEMVTKNSDRIGTLYRDNGVHERETRRVALAILLEQTDLPGVTLARDMDGKLTQDSLYAIEDALDALSETPQAIGGTPFRELGDQAILAFALTKEQEKNSPSPSATTTDQGGSTAFDKSSSTTTTSKAAKDSEPAPTHEESPATPATAT